MTHYRKDIDGLRAIAVISVLLYHYDLGKLNGGYVGVDIFFVISGFLITSILLADIANNRFSLLKFYERRFRRILPALFVMIAVLALAGVLILPPRALEELTRSIVATALFVSNMYFWSANTGYFAGPAETRPLLHTWSLAVEEQFYILFPIFLALVFKFLRRHATWIMLAISIASLALSDWAAANAPTANFYVAPTRAWELLLGAMLALHQPNQRTPTRLQSEALCLLGLALIVYALVSFDASTAVPGIPALAPCLGTALLIFGGKNPSSIVTRLLSTPPFVAVGLISYSLYLWHWPIYVLLRHYLVLAPLSLSLTFGAIATSVALAFLSWQFIEKPFREKRWLPRTSYVFAASAAATTLLVLVGVGGVATAGLPSRFPQLAEVRMQVEEAPPGSPSDDRCFTLERQKWGGAMCQLTFGRPGSTRVLLWGDSFAAHYSAGFRELGDAIPFRVLQYTAPRCPPIIGYRQASNPACTNFNDRVFEIVSDFDIDTVLLSARWDSYLDSRKLEVSQLSRTIDTLRARGLNVVVVGQSPTFHFSYPDDYLLVQARGGMALQTARAWAAFDPELNDMLRNAADGAAFFDPSAGLCRSRNCLIREDGLYIVADSGHLTGHGSRRLVQELVQIQSLRAQALPVDPQFATATTSEQGQQ